AVAVAVHACREATQDVEHPLELALRVVKSPGAGPAVGTGVDGAVAMLADDASDLAGHQRGGTRPVDRHEGIGTAPGLAIAGQPAAANHRLIHAAFVRGQIEIMLAEQCRFRILIPARQPGAGGRMLDLIGAEMGRKKMACHGICSECGVAQSGYDDSTIAAQTALVWSLSCVLDFLSVCPRPSSDRWHG